jgi:hypothetical protein
MYQGNRLHKPLVRGMGWQCPQRKLHKQSVLVMVELIQLGIVGMLC